MPFLIALAVTLHIFVLAPLYLIFSLNNQLEISPIALIGWPLFAAILLGLTIGSLLKFTVVKGWFRPIALFAGFGVYLYLQFYGFVWDFGIFDGRLIDFTAYKDKALVESITLLILCGAAIVRPKGTLPLYGRFLAILLIVSAGFTIWQFALAKLNLKNAQQTTAQGNDLGLTSTNFFRDSPEVMHDITRLSKSQKNIIVLLLDTLQVDVFENVVRNDAELRKQFEGFQLFTNASGHFPYTAMSVPAILSGEPYTAENESIPDYRRRIANKRVEAVLAKQGVEASRIQLESRANFLSLETALCREYGNVYDLFGFRQLPTSLKSAFYDEGRFRFARICGDVPATESEADLAVFKKLVQTTVADSDAPTIKFIHFWGAHPPATLGANCQPIARSPALKEFEGQAHCMLRQAGAYLDKLRSLGVFNNTMMFIISDHGSRLGFLKKSPNADVPFYVMSSATPSLAFHDFGDDREFRTTQAPAMLADIYPTILAQFGNKVEGVGIDLHSLDENMNRARPFIFYKGSADVQNDFLPQFERFTVAGNIHDPAAWSRHQKEKSPGIDIPLGHLLFGNAETSRHLGLGWSAEAAGVSASWIIANPATVSGRLPNAKTIRFTLRFLNPHSDQSISIRLNGRELTKWDVSEPTKWVERSFVFSPNADELGKLVQFEIDVSKIGPLREDLRALGISVRMIDIQSAEDRPTVLSDLEPQLVVNDAPLHKLATNSPVTRDFFDSAWTIEAPDVPVSWIISNPATITGRLPQSPSIRLSISLMSPHKGQRVTVKINGRDVGAWDIPEPTAWIMESLVFTPTAEDLKEPARIEIDVSKIAPTSPQDPRALGIAVKEVNFESIN